MTVIATGFEGLNENPNTTTVNRESAEPSAKATVSSPAEPVTPRPGNYRNRYPRAGTHLPVWAEGSECGVFGPRVRRGYPQQR